MTKDNPAEIHVGKSPKNGPKTPIPPANRRGPVFTSVSQKNRYITIEGIMSDTSYQESQWPEFALKELADNAYEFFLVHYSNATATERKIATSVKLDTTTQPKILHIAVRNSNVDKVPVFQNLRGVFDYERWVSTKRNQHRMTAGGLGDFLKRVLGMGYASWTGNDSLESNDSFEDKQWREPVILRFDGNEYRVFLVVSGDKTQTYIDGPTVIENIGSDTEVDIGSDTIQIQGAQSFLEVLMGFAFKPLYIHRILLMLLIDKQYYLQISQDERPKNRAKVHEELIGRRHVTYTISPKGTIEVAVATTDTPFKLETDEDEAIIFSFLGQVRDRLTYLLNDVRERFVPPIMDWVLKGCDINKDIKINDFKAQLALTDIQMRYADRVFRLYVKHRQDVSVYRVEESLIPNIPIFEALNNIRYPYKVIEEKIDRLIDLLEQQGRG
jgi:hypothetical protein